MKGALMLAFVLISLLSSCSTAVSEANEPSSSVSPPLNNTKEVYSAVPTKECDPQAEFEHSSSTEYESETEQESETETEDAMEPYYGSWLCTDEIVYSRYYSDESDYPSIVGEIVEILPTEIKGSKYDHAVAKYEIEWQNSVEVGMSYVVGPKGFSYIEQDIGVVNVWTVGDSYFTFCLLVDESTLFLVGSNQFIKLTRIEGDSP